METSCWSKWKDGAVRLHPLYIQRRYFVILGLFMKLQQLLYQGFHEPY